MTTLVYSISKHTHTLVTKMASKVAALKQINKVGWGRGVVEVVGYTIYE